MIQLCLLVSNSSPGNTELSFQPGQEQHTTGKSEAERGQRNEIKRAAARSTAARGRGKNTGKQTGGKSFFVSIPMK